MSGVEALVGLLLGALVVSIGLSVVVMYNRFVRQRTLVEESWGQTDVELTRRHDLVPNLVRTVEAYAAHERSLLTELTRAREAARAHRADAPDARQGYEQSLGGAVATTMVRAEAYPELRASENFLHLQAELTDTEDRIAAARRFYNGNVRAYNTRVATFPSNLVAAAFGFRRADFFDLADPRAASAPTVDPGRPAGA
jgi:LemA protein